MRYNEIMFELQTLTRDTLPSNLSEIPEPPDKLYLKGALPEAGTKLLAVVGSRKCTHYGQNVVEHLVRGLEGYPVSIVSGLALGIDGHAHIAALRAGLHTIAIPGSGLDESVLYPRSHARLAQQILSSGGALLSEYEPTQQAAPWTFPKRNRIMAGLADAVLVIEATKRSGTLITARLATEYNKDLLVVPGSIFAESSEGAHQFLKLGAHPVTHAHDILSILGITQETSPEKFLNLKPDEACLYELLVEPLTRDELIEKSGLGAASASVVISKLELDEVIVERGGMIRRV